MGYRVGKHHNKRGWRVLFSRDVKNVVTGEYEKQDSHVPETKYREIQITKDMSIEEVRAVLHKLNLEKELIRQDARRVAISARLKAEDTIECIHLPPPFVEKFENVHLATRYLGRTERLKKVMKQWATCKRVIRTLAQPMDKWARYPEPIYGYFEAKAYSPGYAKDILILINMWIDFLGQELERHYRLVPYPSAEWLSRLHDAFEEGGGALASLPITPEQLKQLSDKMPNQAQFNWVYCTVWAGLRPNEASSLLNPKRTRARLQDGTPILEIYQSKLKNIPNRESRWKYIPLFLPEQQKILEFIEHQQIEEPLSKTLSSRLGEGYRLYGGRKGFHDLMVTRYKQPELEVVRWLGHKSLDMAMKHYAKKDSVRWIPLKPTT